MYCLLHIRISSILLQSYAFFVVVVNNILFVYLRLFFSFFCLFSLFLSLYFYPLYSLWCWLVCSVINDPSERAQQYYSQESVGVQQYHSLELFKTFSLLKRAKHHPSIQPPENISYSEPLLIFFSQLNPMAENGITKNTL